MTSDSLFVGYYASAEFGCFLALGWPLPAATLDLCVEFKWLTCDLPVPCGRSLLGAMAYYGLVGIDSEDKENMRALALRGGQYSFAERNALLEYCQSDVDSLAMLLPRMLPFLDMPRALLRGRYMQAVAQIERIGVPIDTTTLTSLRDNWSGFQDQLIAKIDANYGVYEGRSFKLERWAEYLISNNIPWPYHPSGSLDLSADTFKEMSRSYPGIAPMHDLRHALSKLKLNDLAVGRDGRNRYMLSAFSSKTGRNQPSSSKAIFGPAVWLRNLIKPSHGMAISYIDYEQQEFGIGAALSNDVAMQEAYQTGDPYLAFAQQAGAVPAGATKESHGQQRNQYKQCSLGVQYGMAEESLARKLNVPAAYSRELIHLHKETYPTYWAWSDRIEMTAMLSRKLQAAFGWMVHVGASANPRSLRNFPLQANGAEMLRIACIFTLERGIKICAPVHDALLIEAPEHEIDDAVRECQSAMREASEITLGGFPLRTDANTVRFPNRYSDPRGVAMWDTVMQLLATTTSFNQIKPPPGDHDPTHQH